MLSFDIEFCGNKSGTTMESVRLSTVENKVEITTLLMLSEKNIIIFFIICSSIMFKNNNQLL